MHPEPERLLPIPLFEGLSDEERTRVAGWLEVEEFHPGGRIAREGASDYWFFILEQGTVRVERHGEQIATLGPGDGFGELAILGDGHRQATAIAATDVVIFAMYGMHFREMQISIPEVAARLETLAAQHRGELDESS